MRTITAFALTCLTTFSSAAEEMGSNCNLRKHILATFGNEDNVNNARFASWTTPKKTLVEVFGNPELGRVVLVETHIDSNQKPISCVISQGKNLKLNDRLYGILANHIPS